MKMPFTLQQFLEVFKQYNLSVCPMQLIFYVLGVLVIYYAVWKTKNASAKINLILSFCWLWIGVVYHLHYFTAINTVAYLFAALFITQGVLFYCIGVVSNKLSFRLRGNVYGITGSLFIVYALVVYPVMSYLLGHVYPAAPTFGLPCPTTIFTFGLLLWSNKRVPVGVLIIPLIWSLIGFSAAISLGMIEDVGLLVASIIATIMILRRNSKLKLLFANDHNYKPPVFTLGISTTQLKEYCSYNN